MRRLIAFLAVFMLALVPDLELFYTGTAFAAEQISSTEDADVLSGTWAVGGIIRGGKIYDVHDVEGLEDLYDNTFLWFDVSGRFSYINYYFSEGEYAAFKENSYLLRTKNVYRYIITEDGVDKEDVTSDSTTTYLIDFMDDENTLRFGKLDPVTGKIAADDMPLLFVKKGSESKYIAEHKTAVSGGNKKSDANRMATFGEQNALKRAKEYLEVIAFSYSGLVEQLEYEGFSHSEAAYGADHCGADWYRQAAKKAADYLEIFLFSRSGLIEQLEYEGFTHDEAVYGAEKNGY